MIPMSEELEARSRAFEIVAVGAKTGCGLNEIREGMEYGLRMTLCSPPFICTQGHKLSLSRVTEMNVIEHGHHNVD